MLAKNKKALLEAIGSIVLTFLVLGGGSIGFMYGVLLLHNHQQEQELRHVEKLINALDNIPKSSSVTVN